MLPNVRISYIRHNISRQIPRPQIGIRMALSLLARSSVRPSVCLPSALYVTLRNLCFYSSHACLLPSAPSPPTQPSARNVILQI
ncbi:uncharacterized protein CPUR_03210 [Claviceps purpurea 20.1]|uniref:Uncharacterized protein n=1 Tax=Claviceps purpurea (strain 20.1) TaxID=1111077 RepID=M1VZS1_CLAP2|nr:uncharacterized protein CPUR_03210 [Claviceps purpurea 20.1]